MPVGLEKKLHTLSEIITYELLKIPEQHKGGFPRCHDLIADMRFEARVLIDFLLNVSKCTYCDTCQTAANSHIELFNLIAKD